MIVEGSKTRSPKSLEELCIDSVCRNLADFDQEIPTGLPQVRLLLIAVVSLAAFTRAEKTDLHRKLSPI